MDSSRPPLETQQLAVVEEEVTARDSLVDLVVEDPTTRQPEVLAQQAKDLREDSQRRRVGARVVVVPARPEIQTEQDLVVMAELRPSPEQASSMQVEVLHSTR
jgi:hypothetical protein